VRGLVTEKLTPTRLAVVDDSGGCGASFSVLIVSDAFKGVPIMQRQRLVHDALGAKAMTDIHALSIKAVTGEQFDKRLAEGKFAAALVAALVPPMAAAAPTEAVA